MQDDDQYREQRATFLGGMLAVWVLGGVLFGTFVICGGVTFYIMGVVAGLAVLGYIHYLLWGQSLSEEVADERDEEETRKLLDEDAWSRDEPFGRHRW